MPHSCCLLRRLSLELLALELPRCWLHTMPRWQKIVPATGHAHIGKEQLVQLRLLFTTSPLEVINTSPSHSWECSQSCFSQKKKIKKKGFLLFHQYGSNCLRSFADNNMAILYTDLKDSESLGEVSSGHADAIMSSASRSAPGKTYKHTDLAPSSPLSSFHWKLLWHI